MQPTEVPPEVLANYHKLNVPAKITGWGKRPPQEQALLDKNLGKLEFHLNYKLVLEPDEFMEKLEDMSTVSALVHLKAMQEGYSKWEASHDQAMPFSLNGVKAQNTIQT